MLLTAELIATVTDSKVGPNIEALLAGLRQAGTQKGLNLPHRLFQFLAQTAHESQGFRYDREIWGPTAAQLKYEGRKDLGNTQPGDGYRFRGRGPIQITGRHNVTQFSQWARSVDPSAPDFVSNPDLINTDPWEGLSPIWYWDSRNLNDWADRGDFEGLTVRINGGLNGYEDRLRYYTRFGLALLGYSPTDVKGFQLEHRLSVDGISGPKTRAEIFNALKASDPVRFVEEAPLPAEDSELTRALLAALSPESQEYLTRFILSIRQEK